MPQEALAGGGVGVGVDESADGGVVVAGLEVIEPGFLVRAIALRAKIGFFQGAVTGQKTRFLGLAIDRTASLYSKKV